jgi:mannosyl-3-phosphoglycerate phosphatase
MNSPYIVFTDLDGTLLDYHTYSYQAALPALNYLKRMGIPLILVSSKTRRELIHFQNELELSDLPFVVENGSAIYTRTDYFLSLDGNDVSGDYSRYKLGMTYNEIEQILVKISEKYSYTIRGFHNTTQDEIGKLTSLSENELQRAMNRDFSIPLFYDPAAENILKKEIDKYNMQILYGGRFMHLLGRVDKGKAVEIIMQGYRKRLDRDNLYSVALGDSLNDFAMLKAVDFPILVKRHDGSYERRQTIKDIAYSPGIGPTGWNLSLLSLLKTGGVNE